MRVGVAGCMGYTGFELVKLLRHPNVTLEVVTARIPDAVKKDPRFSLLLRGKKMTRTLVRSRMQIFQHAS